MGEEMVAIPPGRILLRDEGSGVEWGVDIDAFRLAPVPVTREFHSAVLGVRPVDEDVDTAGPRTPITEIGWRDAVKFCNRLSREAGLRACYTLSPDAEDPDSLDVTCDWGADGYRLPTEAEWEYACRAGTTGVRYGELDTIAWYRRNSGETVRDVGTREPNAWGLHDTLGNVWEWCWDRFNPRVYGPYRVFRGGGWNDHRHGCRASCRRKSHPTLRTDDLGFRLARSA